MSTIRKSGNKSARLEARLTPTAYELVQRAAALQGRSVSDFVVMAAHEAAIQVIERQNLLELSQRDQERFAMALLKPARATAALKRAASAHRRLVGRP